METVLLILQVLVAVALIGIILIQHGKGADAGAAFGSGASATVFGARGASSFLSKTTAVLAAVFLANSLLLSYLAAHREQPRSVMEQVSLPAGQPAAGAGEEAPARESRPADLPEVPE